MSAGRKYAEDVVSGRQDACRWVRLMCERHLADLANQGNNGLRFDESAAQHVIDFFGLLKHSKGEWAGRTIVLEPWQQFILWSVFGWLRKDGTRRFRTVYLEVARKNGKSTLAAGIGLYLLLLDGEPGAEVYTAATMRDQARITHSEATRMVKASPLLRRRLRIVKDNIHIPDTASKFVPLGKDADSLDGLNVHGAIIDELHAHKSRDMYDILDTATGSRRQPMLFSITTAGFDRKTVCWQLHEYSEKVLSGKIHDDTFFGCIFTLDHGDDWEDEKVWAKANPNLGVSKKIADLRAKANKAKGMPSALNSFLRLEMNLWTRAETKWMPGDHWMLCGKPVDPEGLRGRTAYIGLDLSSRVDITAEVLVFPPEADTDDDYKVICRFWVPEGTIERRSKEDRVPYDQWVRGGFITAIPGEVIDYDWVFDQLVRDVEAYDIKEIAFDPWNSPQLINGLQKEGVMDSGHLVETRQGFATLSAPMKELEALVRSHRLAHGNNPVLNWMADNVVSTQDPAGNIKPDKEKSTEKIDGIVALIMALFRTLHRDASASVYDERGIREM